MANKITKCSVAEKFRGKYAPSQMRAIAIAEASGGKWWIKKFLTGHNPNVTLAPRVTYHKRRSF